MELLEYCWNLGGMLWCFLCCCESKSSICFESSSLKNGETGHREARPLTPSPPPDRSPDTNYNTEFWTHLSVFPFTPSSVSREYSCVCVSRTKVKISTQQFREKWWYFLLHHFVNEDFILKNTWLTHNIFCYYKLKYPTKTHKASLSLCYCYIANVSISSC